MLPLYQLKIFLFLVICSAWASAGASKQSVDNLIKLYGLEEQVAQFPAQMKAGFQQAHKQDSAIKPEQKEALLKSVDIYISPSNIMNQIQTSLYKSLSQLEVDKTLTWLKSPLGREIARAEEISSAPEFQLLAMQNANELLADKERVELARRLDKLIGGTDFSMGIAEYGSIAVLSAMYTAVNPQAPLNIDGLRAHMSTNAAQTRSEIEKMVTIVFVQTYKNIDMNKLEMYEKFLSDATTMKLNKIITSSMKVGLESALSNWAGSLDKILTGASEK